MSATKKSKQPKRPRVDVVNLKGTVSTCNDCHTKTLCSTLDDDVLLLCDTCRRTCNACGYNGLGAMGTGPNRLCVTCDELMNNGRVNDDTQAAAAAASGKPKKAKRVKFNTTGSQKPNASVSASSAAAAAAAATNSHSPSHVALPAKKMTKSIVHATTKAAKDAVATVANKDVSSDSEEEEEDVDATDEGEEEEEEEEVDDDDLCATCGKWAKCVTLDNGEDTVYCQTCIKTCIYCDKVGKKMAYGRLVCVDCELNEADEMAAEKEATQEATKAKKTKVAASPSSSSSHFVPHTKPKPHTVAAASVAVPPKIPGPKIPTPTISGPMISGPKISVPAAARAVSTGLTEVVVIYVDWGASIGMRLLVIPLMRLPISIGSIDQELRLAPLYRRLRFDTVTYNLADPTVAATNASLLDLMSMLERVATRRMIANTGYYAAMYNEKIVYAGVVAK